MKKLIIVIVSLIVSLLLNFAASGAKDKGFMQQAFESMEANEYETAIVFYDKAVEAKPDYAPAYYGRGLAKAHSDDISGSIEDLEKATDLKSDYHQAHYALGLSYIQNGDYEKAVKSLSEAVSVEEKADYYYARANAYKLAENYDKALVDYSNAIETDQYYGIAYYGRGALHKLQGRGDASLQDLEKYLEMRGNQDGLEKEVKRLIKEIKEGRVN